MFLSAHAAKLTWEDPGDSELIVGYRVYWKLSADESLCPTDEKAVHSIDVGKEKFYGITDDKSFIPGKTYEFQVKAFNTTGERSNAN